MLFGTIKQDGGADKHTNIYEFYVEHTTISRVGGRADINDIKASGNCKIILQHLKFLYTPLKATFRCAEENVCYISSNQASYSSQ